LKIDNLKIQIMSKMKGALFCIFVDKSRVFIFQGRGESAFIVVPQTLFNKAYLRETPRGRKGCVSKFCEDHQEYGFMCRHYHDGWWNDFIVDKPIPITKEELKKYFDGCRVTTFRRCIEREHAFEIVHNRNSHNRRSKEAQQSRDFWDSPSS